MVVVGRGVVVGGVGLGGGVGRLVNVLVVQRKFTIGLPRRPVVYCSGCDRYSSTC